MGRMHRVHEQHGLVVAQGIQQLFIARNEGLLLLFVELARDDFRLVIFKPEPMQQRNHSRAAFVRQGRIPRSIQAPIWRVVRGSAAATQTFSFSCCCSPLN